MIQFADGRQRVVNYVDVCNNFADSYPEGVFHGLQKDAIQNALDARDGRKIVNIRFEVIRSETVNFITITDSNTTGLTGPVLYKADAYEDPLPDDYHWARFESFAFTKNDPDAIGARGQGKFIFLRASNHYTMYYDTLREDGLYRLGGTQAKTTGCPILPSADEEPWENSKAKQMLINDLGLEPISEVGTRVIILDPCDEILDSIVDGLFARAIQETWYRAIEKKILTVEVVTDTSPVSISPPDFHPLPTTDTGDDKTWILGQDFKEKNLPLANGGDLKVKSFQVAYLPKQSIPKEMQGISIIHNGMKISSIGMTNAPTDIREHITGFIEFDRALDQELRKGINQFPNHYDLKWRRKVPRAIKNYIATQLEAFGRKKLGLGLDSRVIQRRRRTEAEDWAFRQLMKYGKDLDLFGAKGIFPPPITTDPPQVKEIAISLNNFRYPNPTIAPRVNWGSVFQELGTSVHNNTNNEIKVYGLVQILYGDTTVLTLLDKTELVLQKNSKLSMGIFDIEISKRQFAEPGLYRISASLFNQATGDKLDSVARRFWVEINPPLRAPFAVEKLRSFPEELLHRQWFTSGAVNSSPSLFFNLSHPAYLAVEEDQDQQNEYWLEIILEGAMNFILNRADKEDGSPDFHPLSEDQIFGDEHSADSHSIPADAYSQIIDYLSEFRWKYYEGG